MIKKAEEEAKKEAEKILEETEKEIKEIISIAKVKILSLKLSEILEI